MEKSLVSHRETIRCGIQPDRPTILTHTVAELSITSLVSLVVLCGNVSLR